MAYNLNDDPELRDWYKVPNEYNYFVAGAGAGGTATNIKQAPVGTILDFGDKFGQADNARAGGYGQYFQQGDGHLIPYFGDTSNAQKVYTGGVRNIYDPNGPTRTEALPASSMGGLTLKDLNSFYSVAPLEFAIKPGQTAEQSTKAYNTALNDTTTPRTDANGNSPTPSGSVSSQGGLTSSAAPSSTAVGGGGFTSFVKTPNDNTVYGVTANGQHVGFESWDQLLAANGGQAPQIQTINSTPASSINYTQYTQAGSNQTPAPDLGPYADLYKQMQDYLDKLQKNGQVINPNVQITPDQLAAFATQAATQIHPYYATQLGAATDSFLSNLGYNTDQFKNSISQAQTQYGRNLETLGASAADRGFAQSGIRQKEEGQLASDTQNNLDQLRGSLFNTSQNAARQFATTYGGAQVPGAPQIGAAPRVLSGQSQFDTSGSNSGIYQLDPNIYSRLIGSEQNSEKSATDTLASQLATNANQLTANTQARSLI